jgi:hypothetical protein
MFYALLIDRRLLVLMVLGLQLTPAGGRELVFNRDIRPILSENCFACHGADAKKRKADLRLDDEAGAKAALEKGRVAIKPGDPEGSELWQRVITDEEDDIMPPPESHKTLSAGQKETLKQWIAQGAKYQKHWSFEALVKPAPPSGIEAGALDAFVVARLKQEGLDLAPPADKATLIRRVTLDLSGLPPAPEEVAAFLADASPDAYQKLVARLLASPRFGEHMAHWWLDLARYGDTHGLHLDNERQTWLYRDWVVSAFNRNQPYDQFTVEQLAGDLIPGATDTQKVASGYNRCNVTTSEGGSINEELLFRYAVDRASNTMQNWLGLTGQCAVCHDHKFDPITQKEFYQMYAFFYSAADPAMDGNALLTAPVIKYTAPEQTQKLEALKARKAALQEELMARVRKAAYSDPADSAGGGNAQRREQVWMDDAFPPTANVKAGPGADPTKLTGEPEIKPASGKLALKRQDAGLAQDFCEDGAATLEIPGDALIHVMVRVDAANPPKAVMLQFKTDGWKHRAVWGDVNAISYGAVNTTERYSAGPLPKAGEWVKLEVPADKVGLKAGDRVTGFAFTQFAGLVYWDRLSVSGTSSPKANPGLSFKTWRQQNEGKDVAGAPAEIKQLLKIAADKATPAQSTTLREYFLAAIYSTNQAHVLEMRASMAAMDKEISDLDTGAPSTFIMADLPNKRQAKIMERGAYDKPGESVQPQVPSFLPPLPAGTTTPNRLDLAKWIVSPENPLTARVAVNRFWQHLFGLGLVKNSGDFGSQGDAPSHAELLDFLAVGFRESGWDMKRLITAIVTSRTYQQGSNVKEDLFNKDPENRLLARAPRLRLNAEAIRDQALLVSGLLVEKAGGKGVKTYQPPNIWEPVGFAGSNTRDYRQDSGESLYRRSLYTFLKRTAPAPFLANFDAPSREAFCTKRERGNTPLQALQLLNDVQFFEAARAFAQRIMSKGGATPEDRLAFGFQCAVNRPPDATEAARVLAMLNVFLEKYRANPALAATVIAVGESKPDAALPPVELAAWTQVGNFLLNLDETIVRP